MIAPSMMCADFLNLGNDVRTFEKCGAEYLHIDIMDGEFVRNYTLGTDYIRKMHEVTKIPLDIHLMIKDPSLKIGWFEIKPGDYVSVHVEADGHIQRSVAAIKAAGGKAMAALNPGTPLCMLEDLLPDLDGVLLMTVNPGFAGQKLVPQTLGKITRLRRWLDELGYENTDIEVDGNVSFENAVKMSEAGANIFVAGSSSIWSAGADVAENTARLRKSINI